MATINVSFSGVKKSVEKVVLDVKTKVIDEFETYVKENVDEESFEALKELFAGFKNNLSTLSLKLDEDVQTKKGSRKSKKASDGTVKEKKALSPYNIFIKETIESLKKNNPEMKGQELMKKATEAWKVHKASGKQ